MQFTKGEKMKKYLILMVIGILFISTISCNENSGNNNEATAIDFDYDVSSDLEQLASKSNFILVGEFTEVIDEVNTARDPQDLSKENAEVFVISERVKFEISEVLYGKLDVKEISVMQIKEVGDHAFEHYTSPTLSEKVIVFLRDNSMINQVEPLDLLQFEASSAPFIFQISDDKIVKLVNKSDKEKSNFKDKEFNLDKLLKIINK